MAKRNSDHTTLWVEHGIDVPGKTVYLKGDIDADTLDTVTTAFHLFGPDADVKVIINSPGGCLVSGLAIYDILKAHSGVVTAIVKGEASSCGCLILQAADHRLAQKHSMILHHCGSSGAPNDHRVNFFRRAEADKRWFEMFDNAMLARVNEKRAADGENPLTLKQWQKEDLFDTYLTAQQAIDLGLLDEIVSPA